jgi:hypothetical protein
MNETIFDEINQLTKQKLASDMPKSIVATVVSIGESQSAFGKNLKLGLQTQDEISFFSTYRIPKALTGKGQLVQLLDCLKKIGLSIDDIQGKTFEWQRMELSGTMKGNPRHYPVQLVKA